MGLVKTRRRLAEDMHRRGEASEGTLPKATRRARKRVRSPYQAVRKQQRAVRECCQCGNVASSNVASFQLGIGNAKLPNGMLPDCRTDSRQTTEWLLRVVGYFDIMFAT